MKYLITSFTLIILVTSYADDNVNSEAHPFAELINHIKDLKHFTNDQKNTLTQDVRNIVDDLSQHHHNPSKKIEKAISDNLVGFIDEEDSERRQFSDNVAMLTLSHMKSEMTLMISIAYCRIDISQDKVNEVDVKLGLLKSRVDKIIDIHFHGHQSAEIHAFNEKSLSIAIANFDETYRKYWPLQGYYLNLSKLDEMIREPGIDLSCMKNVDYSSNSKAMRTIVKALDNGLMDISGSPFFNVEDGKTIHLLNENNENIITLLDREKDKENIKLPNNN